MKFQGIVKAMTDSEQVTEKVAKRTVVIEAMGDSQYNDSIAVDFVNDRQSHLDSIKVGDIVTVQLNSRCNESKTQAGKYFNTISGWKIETIANKAE